MWVIATGNAGKVREIRAALTGLGIDVVAANELSLRGFPPEDQGDYTLHAHAKATFAARATGCIALADDSGLEVDALGGAPGVESANFGGPGLSDAERTALLLRRLADVPDERRGATFVSVVVLVDPEGASERFEGRSPGRITREMRGDGGFGYDPIFYSDALGRTFAEATLAEKGAVGHRGRALAALRAFLTGPGGARFVADRAGGHA
jgi:XTP/dITP diphosphohydrolase